MRFAICLLHVADMEKALAFYRDALSLAVRYASPEYVAFDRPRQPSPFTVPRVQRMRRTEQGFSSLWMTWML